MSANLTQEKNRDASSGEQSQRRTQESEHQRSVAYDREHPYFVTKKCSANRPKLNLSCGVAVDGHTDGYNNEGKVDEPSARTDKM